MIPANIRYSHRMTFLARGKSGHVLPLDGAAEVGGDDSACRPKELVLFALGGCTAFDVISILHKRRLDVQNFTIEMEALEAEEHPKVFTEVRLRYVVEGPDIPDADVERAVRLSQEKYCSVSAMMRRAFPIHWAIVVNGREVARGVEGD